MGAAAAQNSREPCLHWPDGPVAQLVEQGTFNPKVTGSIPARPKKTTEGSKEEPLREVGLTALAACTQRSDVHAVDRLEDLAPHSSGEEITIGADGIRNPRYGVSRELDR